MNCIDELKAANALGGKTARACESCLRKRARWFCAADGAFLCQDCDATVHSANQLASRHERVRLETSSCKVHKHVMNASPAQAWHQGFTRKARTPRHAKSKQLQPPPTNPLPLVPEMNGEDPIAEENEELMLCMVPVFDPFHDDFCSEETIRDILVDEAEHDRCELSLAELLKCDIELDEFSANIESLLGEDDDSAAGKNDLDSKTVKVEDEDVDEETQVAIASHFDPALDMEMNRDFDYACSSIAGEDNIGEEMKKKAASIEGMEHNNIHSDLTQVKKIVLLSLNHEAVLADWETQGSPWTTGFRPDELNLDDIMITSLDGDLCGGRWGSAQEIAEREARVSRYREKRRTRLFSRKIRYQVRKINAEKRPRLKGRFVKRASFLGSSFPAVPLPPYLMNR